MRAVPVPVYRPKLEIRLSAKDLPRMDVASKSDPVALVYLSENNQPPQEIGRTEKISNTQHPVWQTPIRVEYKFEVLQKLTIRVGDVDHDKVETIGEAEVSVADLISQRGRAYATVLRHGSHEERGALSITAAEVFEKSTPYEGFVIQCSARNLDAKDINGKSDPYFYILKVDRNGITESIRKSMIIKSTLNPEWEPETFTVEELCDGDLNTKLIIEVWDWDKIGENDLIGRFTTSMADILAGHREHKLIHPKKKTKKKHYSDSGNFAFNVKPIQKFSFLQYLQSGIQISLTVAVDFTGSNRETKNLDSLHYIGGPGLNQYQEAITKIGSIVCPYDTDQRFALFGFGGEYKPSTTSDCFPLNENDSNPEVVGLQGLLDTYKEAVGKFGLSGPTNFAPFLKQVRKIAENAKHAGAKTYYVVLILTDGQVDDEHPTTKEIVDASNDPMSIIIVGVGSADFNRMEKLDCDYGKLVSVSNGKKAERDVVQFVSFLKHKDNPYALAQEVLAEVPSQLVSYYESINYMPVPMPVYPLQPEYTAYPQL